ncbi:sugar O-acetyltransferase [Parasphingorhabdus litoris]|uniref:Sugar O-acetyltransferase n=1 Tax=Parasphingorhabdus litoris TaxID=394733 RepID=A0ABP3JUU0_9SPHN|nr:sugar O-acetyltransferase [Parasphingorhabdus litoris]
MQSGDLYDPGDPGLRADRASAQQFLRAYNRTTAEDHDIRRPLLSEHLGAIGKRATIRAPFYVDYGYNIFIGDNVFLNFGCVLLDVCKIEIGTHTQIGPGVQIYTADHPRDSEERRAGIEFGKPISIGSNVWIGGHAIILPGVSIGNDSIIGAGSVITRDVVEGTSVAGNPARIIR